MNPREAVRRPGSAEYHPRVEGLESGRLDTRLRAAMQKDLTDPNSLYRKTPGGFRLQTDYEDRLVEHVMPGLLEDTDGNFPMAIGAIESLRVHQQRVPFTRDLGRAMRDSLTAVQGAVDMRARELVRDNGRRITDDLEQHQIYGLATKLYTFQQQQADKRQIEYRAETETDRLATEIAEQLLAATSAEDISYAAKKGRGSLAAEARGRIAAIYHNLADENQDNPETLQAAWKQAKADLLQFARSQDAQEARAITRSIQSFTGLSNYYADLDAVRKINPEAGRSIAEVKRLLREAKATPVTPEDQQEVEAFQDTLAVLAQDQKATVEDLLARTAEALDYSTVTPQTAPEVTPIAPTELIQAAAEPIVEEPALPAVLTEPAIGTRDEEPELVLTSEETTVPLSPKQRLVAGATRLWNGIRQAGQAVDRFMHTYEGIDTQAVAATVAADEARPRDKARIVQNAARFGSLATATELVAALALGVLNPKQAVAAESDQNEVQRRIMGDQRAAHQLVLDHNPAEQNTAQLLARAREQAGRIIRSTQMISETEQLNNQPTPENGESPFINDAYKKVMQAVKEGHAEIIIEGIDAQYWDSDRLDDEGTTFQSPATPVVQVNGTWPSDELIAQSAGVGVLKNNDIEIYAHNNLIHGDWFTTDAEGNRVFNDYRTWDNLDLSWLVRIKEQWKKDKDAGLLVEDSWTKRVPNLRLIVRDANNKTDAITYSPDDVLEIDPTDETPWDEIYAGTTTQDGEMAGITVCQNGTAHDKRVHLRLLRDDVELPEKTPAIIPVAPTASPTAIPESAPVAPAVEQPAAQPVLPVAPRATDDNSEVDELRERLEQQRQQKKDKKKQKPYTTLLPMVQTGNATIQSGQPTPETQAPMQEAVTIPNELTGNIQTLIDKLYESGSARSFGNKGGLSEVSVLVNSQLLQGALARSNFGSTDEWLEEMLKNYDAIFANTNAGNERGTVAGLGNGYFIRGRDRAQILDAGWAEKHMPAFDKTTKKINAWDFRPGSVPVVTFRLRMDPKGKITLPNGKHADLLIDNIQYQTPAAPALHGLN